MVMCWAPDCRHYNVREKCHFFRFPKEPKERNRWKELLRRHVEPGVGAFVCSCHFRDGKKENGPELFEPIAKKRLSFSSSQKKTRKRVVKAPRLLETNIREQQEGQTVYSHIQGQGTSGPLLDIKEDITIDEYFLEDYLDIPKFEEFENTSTATRYEKDSLSEVEIQALQQTVLQSTPQETTAVSYDTSDKSHNKQKQINDETYSYNIIPKLEIFETTSGDIIRVDENRNCPNVENRDDHVDYAMYIADRLYNANRSDRAIAMAKQKIELILCDLETGIFESNEQKKKGDEDSKVEEPSCLTIPKLEIFGNASSEDIIRDEVENQPLQETILQCTLKDNIQISPSSSNKSHSKRRKISDKDSRVEDDDFLNAIQVGSENRDDYVIYAMYIATRFKNANQSNRAISMAKQKIELILYDLETGMFENSFR